MTFYRLSGSTFYDCINTIYLFIKPFLDDKVSVFLGLWSLYVFCNIQKEIKFFRIFMATNRQILEYHDKKNYDVKLPKRVLHAGGKPDPTSYYGLCRV